MKVPPPTQVRSIHVGEMFWHIWRDPHILVKTAKLFKPREVIQKGHHFSKWLSERRVVFERFENILTDDS